VKRLFGRQRQDEEELQTRADAFIESFNGGLRQQCLNQNWFLSLADAKERIEPGSGLPDLSVFLTHGAGKDQNLNSTSSSPVKRAESQCVLAWSHIHACVIVIDLKRFRFMS